MILILLLTVTATMNAQEMSIPGAYTNIESSKDGRLYFKFEGNRFYADTLKAKFTIKQLQGDPQGTTDGLTLDFGDFEGSITYGLIPYGQSPHPLPVFRFVNTLDQGKSSINIIDDFKYPYDFVDWKENENLTIGYRLIDEAGMIVFDGEVSLTGSGPFEVAPAIYEGPFINNLTNNTAVIWCSTTLPVKASVKVNGKTYQSEQPTTHHEWEIQNLSPSTRYEYIVQYGALKQQYHFTTAPEKGSRKPFVFGYTSDSRHATGGGERKIYGANGYIVKKMAALAYQQGAAFVQFTGDMINGYLSNNEEMQVQYTNWKNAIAPFWHYIPFNVGMGNHEALGYVFRDENGSTMAFVDGFPYDTHSAETAFAEAFVNPFNGPESEDGSAFDPDPNTIDFPSTALRDIKDLIEKGILKQEESGGRSTNYELTNN